MSLPEAYVAHASMARVRLRIPSRRNDQAYFDSARQRLSARAEVVSLEANPATASLLLRHYCPLERLYAVALEEELFVIGRARPSAGRSGFPNMATDLSRLAVPVLVGLSAIQALRGNVLGPAAGLMSLALAVATKAKPGMAED